MIDVEEFLSRILPFAPGCPEPSAIAAIIEAARVFCRRTRLWRSTDQMTATTGSSNCLCAPAGAEVFEVESLSFEGADLKPISIADLDDKQPGWREYTGDSPRWFTQTDIGEILLVPPGAGVVKMATILLPSMDATQLPDFLYDQYAKDIANGALAEILLLPKRDFTDPNMAGVYQVRFDATLDALATRPIKGQQRARVRSRSEYF